MPALVRILDDKSWFDLIDPDQSPDAQNIRADAAVNFCAEDCRLSFFSCEGEGAVIESIAAAVSSGGPQLDDVDYWVVSSEDLEGMGFTLDATVNGLTPMDDVNKLHVDVCGVNLARLQELVMHAVAMPETGRVRRSRVKQLLLEAIAAKKVDGSKLRKGVQQFLGL